MAPKDQYDSSFTSIVIEKVKQHYLDTYDAKLLRETLGHIYHYYIYVCLNAY